MNNSLKKTLASATIVTLIALTTSACSTNPVGSTASKEAPRLVSVDTETTAKKNFKSDAWDGNKATKARWDRPSAFGPVPDALKAAGNSICQKAGFDRATGYHPQAIGLNGQAIKGGGFFCGG